MVIFNLFPKARSEAKIKFMQSTYSVCVVFPKKISWYELISLHFCEQSLTLYQNLQMFQLRSKK